jgi:tagatose-6-phosphate ketose/aldose isomerase
MNDSLDLNNEFNDEKGLHTSSEILNQPSTWEATFQKFLNEQDQLSSFLNTVLSLENLNIVLTGAGSSAFVGDVVKSTWQKYIQHPTQAIPTTDLVTHFDRYVMSQAPLLLISFARSGNSPESKAAIDVAEKNCQRVFHLVITCNPDGELAQMKGNENTCVFLLPPKAEDQSLAMTNSFTSMALAATLIPLDTTSESQGIEKQVSTLIEYGNKFLDTHLSKLREISDSEFDRIIFLGSGPLQGIARESHLKVQELTNGQVIGKFDSFLGFRHGPKAIIDDQTLLVYLLSNDSNTERYEEDLIKQIAQHKIDLTTLGISETNQPSHQIDHLLYLNEEPLLNEEFWAILCTLPAQVIGYYKSLLLGYDPDNPSPDGTISRVVEGVKIYSSTPETISN